MSMYAPNPTASLLEAVNYAARMHRDQRRKGADAPPYINHPIEVADLLARVGGVDDLVTLRAAVLHDTVEDTAATFEDIETIFGPEVRHVVAEVTDDKTLTKDERKRLQIEHAPHLSSRAKLVKLADKISNAREITQNPPSDWTLERRAQYLDWSAAVVAGIRGINEPLERLFDQCIIEGRERLAAENAPAAQAASPIRS